MARTKHARKRRHAPSARKRARMDRIERRTAHHDRANYAIRRALVDSLYTCDPEDSARIQRAIRVAESLA